MFMAAQRLVASQGPCFAVWTGTTAAGSSGQSYGGSIWRRRRNPSPVGRGAGARGPDGYEFADYDAGRTEVFERWGVRVARLTNPRSAMSLMPCLSGFAPNC